MRKNFIIQHQLPDTAISRFQYVVDFINAHPLKPAHLLLVVDNTSPDKDLFYGNNSEKNYTVPLDACFLDETKVIDRFYPTQFSCSDNHLFFSVSEQATKADLFLQDKRFGFDIFNTLFFHISRYEEYYAPAAKNGQSGWLKEDHHFLVENNLNDYPVVDQLLVSFFEIITNKKITQKSTYAISHDVDILTRFTPSYKFFRSLVGTVIKRRGWAQFWDNIAYYKKMIRREVEDPYDYFTTLLRLENRWKSKHIFMMAGGNTRYDNKYQINDPATINILQMALDRSYSVGLHPSYNAGFEADYFIEEQKKLEKVTGEYIVNNRQHWLRWSWKVTPYLFEKNGITTDSSMGYSRYLGFRCGTGFPYQMYDFKNKKAFNWIEHPMAFMESSAIHRAQQTRENLTKLMRNFLLKNKENTHLMLNFHNSNFDPLLDTGRQLRRFYEKELIDLCYGQKIVSK